MSKVVSYAISESDRASMVSSVHMTNKRYVDGRDASIKKYVGDQAAVVRAKYVFTAGDYMIGDLSMGGHSQSINHMNLHVYSAP